MTDPILLIFELLSLCRTDHAAAPWRLRRAWLRRGLPRWPRLSFWLRLCRAAHLLDHACPPRPTILAEQWLRWPRAAQMAALLQAWQSVPVAARQRQLRRRLLARLQPLAHRADSSSPLLPAGQVRELAGLVALGLWRHDSLTPTGRALLASKPQPPTVPPRPWQLRHGWLRVPLPANWPLLWRLEAYLEPVRPGLYRLSDAAIAHVRTGRPGPVDQLAAVLCEGLRRPLPEALARKFSAPPVARLMAPTLLEFDDPATLVSLRRSRALRGSLANVISPRHVSLPPGKAARVVHALARRGVAVETGPAPMTTPAHVRERGAVAPRASTSPRSPPLSQGERAWLLALALAAQAGTPAAALPQPSPELIARLEAGLPEALRQAARRLAHPEAAPGQRTTPTNTSGTDWPPAAPAQPLRDALHQAAASSTALDVLYHVPGRPQPEARRLTPLLLEQRGGRHYLLAWCHTRRANRTFRLDRMQLAQGAYCAYCR